MKKQIEYIPEQLLFPGFHDTYLLDETIIDQARRERGCDVKVDSLPEYRRAVCEAVAERIAVLFDDEICDSCVYDSVTSPNFAHSGLNDIMHLVLNIDLDALAELIMDDDELYEGFDEYLYDRYSSCGDVISDTADNALDYFGRKTSFGKDTFAEFPKAAIDYYLLAKVYGTANVVRSETTFVETGFFLDVFTECGRLLGEHLVPSETAKD